MLKCSDLVVFDSASMDAKDMVKWFKPDGSAVREDLSPVKVNLFLSFHSAPCVCTSVCMIFYEDLPLLFKG